MRSVPLLSLAACAAALANCSQSEAPVPVENEVLENDQNILAEAFLAKADGTQIGSVALEQDGDVLSLEIAIEGLDAGQHGFHLHSVGKCEVPDFKSAGGHLNPFGKSHGRNSANGKHLGDLPNISIFKEGVFSQTIALDGDASQVIPTIFDEDGTAVVIHAGPDDYTTDPAGASGPRLACGVLKQID